MSTSSRFNQLRTFGVFDWFLLFGTGAMWGSSFILVHFTLIDVTPGALVWLRLLFGTLVLTMIPHSWKRLRHTRDWWLVLLLAFVWMAVPFTLIAIAQQSIDSSLAGMINGISPLVTALIAALWFRIRPTKTLTAGLILGFIGIIVVLLPTFSGTATNVGIAMMVLAAVLYGVAFNVSGVLHERGNGALSVIWRAQLIAVVLTAPFGFVGLQSSTITVPGLSAVMALGIFSTGLAYITFQLLVGRVGASRASIATYLTPIIALLLGTLIAGDSLHPVSLVGMALVLLGAYVASRGRKAARES